MSVQPMMAEMFAKAAGIQITPIHYQGSTPGVVDMLGGRVELMFDGAGTGLANVRSGKLAVNERIMAAMLLSRDEIARLLDEVGGGSHDPAAAAAGAALGAELRDICAGGQGAAAPANAATPAAAPAEDHAEAVAATAGAWQLSLRFGGDALRNGLDPLSFIRYLDSVGTVLGITTLDVAVPALEQLDPEHCHLGFEIRLDSDGPQARIEDVFEFCVEDCDIAVLPPNLTAQTFDDVLARRCGDDEEAQSALLAVWATQGFVRPKAPAAAPAPAAVADKVDAVVSPAASAPTPAAPAAASEAAKRPAARGGRSHDPQAGSFIRVRADKLDRLIDIIGELVIASSGAQLVAEPQRRSVVLAWWRAVKGLWRQPGRIALYLLITAAGLLLAAALGVLRLQVAPVGGLSFAAALLAGQAVVAALGWMRCARLFAMVNTAQR